MQLLLTVAPAQEATLDAADVTLPVEDTIQRAAPDPTARDARFPLATELRAVR
jgi:hypothetical protein